MSKIGNEWDEVLKDEFQKEYFKKIKAFLVEEYKNGKVFPPKKEILSAFQLTPLNEVKVVILGQDPYHGEGQAHGLAFSVKKGVKVPPSLRNMYKEIYDEGEGTTFNHGFLESWAKQGVFLLNASLTVREGEANSHSKIGWETFTDEVIKIINEKREGVIFLLWGNNARSKKKYIDEKKHIVLETVHPSPLSANRGFLGCGHFKKVNDILKSKGEKCIDWNIF